MAGAARQGGGGKGRSELGNERTWPSGSALSRKPSRRSGPIKRPPPSPLPPRSRFIISTQFFNMAVVQPSRRPALFFPDPASLTYIISRFSERSFIGEFYRIPSFLLFSGIGKCQVFLKMIKSIDFIKEEIKEKERERKKERC